MKRWLSLPVFLLPFLAGMAPAAAAEEAPAAPPAVKRISLAVRGERPRIALARVGELAGEAVLVDSTVQAPITADWRDKSVEEVLDDACKALGVAWKRVYLPPGTAANPDNVSQIYRSLRALYAGGLVAFEPGSEKGTILLLNTKLPKDTQTVMEQPNSGFWRAYLVLDERKPLVPQAAPPDDERPWQPGEPLTPKKMARMQREMFAALSRMAPEERQAAMAAAMVAQMDIFAQNPQLIAQFVKESATIHAQFMTQHPEMMQTITQAAMQAQIEALQEMTPEQRTTMLKAQMDAVKQIPKEQMQQLIELMKPAAGQ